MQGSHFHLPVWRMDMAVACEQFHTLNLPVLASTLSSDSIDYKDFAAPQQFALVMGNEGNGISENMAQQATHLVHISREFECGCGSWYFAFSLDSLGLKHSLISL